MSSIASSSRPAAPAMPAFVLPRWTPILAVGVLLALVPVLAAAFDQPFLVRVAARVIVFSVAAVSLNLLLGQAGLVSVMHAGILGLGGYVVAILASHAGDAAIHRWLPWPGTTNLLVAGPLAVLACALASAVLGAVALRTRGAYFIMITLAFNQMLYYLFVAADRYGGDEGLQVKAPLRLGSFALEQPVHAYGLALAVLLAVMALYARLVRSRFGVVVRAAAGNERRVHSVGIPAGRYQLAALAIAGAGAGLAGVLLVATQQFVSPADMTWTRSGELIVMVVLGGTAAIWGPVAGVAVFLLLELGLSGLSIHWQLAFGVLIILMVVFLRSGISGLVQRLLGAARRS